MSSRLETFRAMVAQHPDNVLARFGLANEALKEGLHAEAAEQLRAYLAAYDDEGNGYGRLALALEGEFKRRRAVLLQGGEDRIAAEAGGAAAGAARQRLGLTQGKLGAADEAEPSALSGHRAGGKGLAG